MNFPRKGTDTYGSACTKCHKTVNLSSLPAKGGSERFVGFRAGSGDLEMGSLVILLDGLHLVFDA
jgi:cytochrome c5